MTSRDDDLLARLTDPADPRTPLHVKLLDRQTAPTGGFALRVAPCAFHRTTGYAVGITMRSARPISKLFHE